MRSVTININQTCPLNCRHCSLGFSSDDHNKGRTLSPEEVQAMVEAIDPDHYRIALFAGGEPTLNPELISAGSEAAVARGLIPAVVTAPIWARSDHAAQRLIKRVRPVQLVILSYDKYHLEFLRREDYLRAVRIVRSAGLTPVLQVSAATEDEGNAIIAEMGPLVGREMINVVPVVGVGNALSEETMDLSDPIETINDFSKVRRSCVVGNAFIDEDGGLHGCCWASAVPEAPISLGGDMATLAGRFAELEASEPFARMVRAGFLDSLSEAEALDLLSLVRGQRFASECDLCLAAMRAPDAPFWAALAEEEPVDA